MRSIHRTLTAVAVAAVLMIFGTGCSEIADPDKVGLYYMKGEVDGYKFGHCVDPGASDDWVANNEVKWFNNNLRTWNIATTGGDTNEPITVQSAPEPAQPSGVQVNVWPQTNFMLNTTCSDGNSPLVQWWERIGRRYDADTDKGWKDMLNATVVPALQKATRTVVRRYAADPLVAGTNLPEVQQNISTEFQTELKRLVGGDYFCGPTFDRKAGTCPAVEVLVKDIDYTDPGIQAARNEKQKAIETAAAEVAAAQGQVDAANKLNTLYSNEAWVRLQIAEMNLKAIEFCGKNPTCHMVIGADGNVLINAG